MRLSFTSYWPPSCGWPRSLLHGPTLRRPAFAKIAERRDEDVQHAFVEAHVDASLFEQTGGLIDGVGLGAPIEADVGGEHVDILEHGGTEVTGPHHARGHRGQVHASWSAFLSEIYWNQELDR